MPMAASARSQRIPPCTVPRGLECWGPASISNTTRPGSMEPMVKPMRVATGGGGSSPRWTFLSMSSDLGIRVRLSPRARFDGGRDGESENHEGHCHGREDSRQAPAEPVAGEPAPCRGHDESEESGGEWPAETSRTLRGEVQREPQSKESVERPHDEEIRDADGLSLRVRGEEAQPQPRKHGGKEAEGGGHPGRDARSGPRHPLRAVYLSGADIGAYHGHERRSHAEDEGNLQILEARAHAVAGEGWRAESSDQSGDEHHGEVGQDGVDGAGSAHAQD